MTCTSTRRGFERSDAVDLAELEHAQQLGLRPTSGSSPISSRNSVPPSASSKSPGLLSVAPVNAPRMWPNSSLSKSVSTTAEQLTVTNRRSRRGPILCSARATSSLPVPVSPVIERGPDVRRQPADHAEQLLHERARGRSSRRTRDARATSPFDRRGGCGAARSLRESPSAAARAGRSRAACSGSPSRRA